MSALDRMRQAAVLRQTGVLVPLPKTAKQEAPVDIPAMLKSNVASAYRQRAEQCDRRTAADPRARADASVFRDCEAAASAGYMPLIVGTRVVPGLPADFNEVTRAAVAAGLTRIVSTDRKGW